MAPKHLIGIMTVAACLSIFDTQRLGAQNNYPVSGDALIHGLTIGTGRGNYVTNTALGDSALWLNKSGQYNVAVGRDALYRQVTGLYNTAVGYQSLYLNSTGQANVAAGPWSLYSNTIACCNVALGMYSLYKSDSGGWNQAIGFTSLYNNTVGYHNAAYGNESMYNNTSGNDNSAFGPDALVSNTTGWSNSALGSWADVAAPNLYWATALGSDAIATAANSVMVGNSWITSIGGYVNWTNFSDGRYKKIVSRNVPGLTFINKLEPITYTLDVSGIESRLHANKKMLRSPDGQAMPDPLSNPEMQRAMKEKSQIVYTGFVAQDVETAAKSLGYNFSGVDKPKDDQQSFYGLRYSDFVMPLVKAAQELSAQNDSLRTANAGLSARLDQIEQLLGIGQNGQNSSALSLSAARLFQNIPNPYSQNTLISYYIPQNAGAALLQVTSMNGKIVKSIAVNGSGYGRVSVQTDQLASGTYTYSLFVDGRLIDTKKMVMVK